MSVAVPTLSPPDPALARPNGDFQQRLRLFFVRVLSLPACCTAAFTVLIFLLVPRAVTDPDIWWHLRDAEWQLQHHAWINHDLFSYTVPGTPWINHEWLAELPFYFAWSLGRFNGLYLLTVTVIELIFLGVLYLSYRKSRSLIASVIVSLTAALLGTISFAPRPLLFGWLFLVLELLILEGFVDHPRRCFLLPGLFFLWINTHGSWMIGFALLLLFLVSGLAEVDNGAIRNKAWSIAQRRGLCSATLLSVASLFLNPYGWRLVAYPFNLAFAQKLNVANVEEWRPLDLHSPRGRVLLLALAVLFLAQLYQGRRWTLRDLASLGIGVYAAATYSRFLFLAGILVLPLLAPYLSFAPLSADTFNQPPSTRAPIEKPNGPWLHAVLLLLLGVPVFEHFSKSPPVVSADPGKYPIEALPFLRRLDPSSRVFNEYLWGGFLVWNVRNLPVMIDSRVDIFEYGGVFRDYLDAVRLRDPFAVLEKYGIRYVVFEPQTPLVLLLSHSPEWKIDYEDKTTVILERVSAAAH